VKSSSFWRFMLEEVKNHETPFLSNLLSSRRYGASVGQ
jgi:hypothetical protein